MEEREGSVNMRREVNMDEISDGKRYTANDLVKVGVDGCRGCCDCCKGMGDSIKLDPMDVCKLSFGLNVSVEELFRTTIELKVSDGIVLPNLKIKSENDSCSYLDKTGRCSIHSIRPGLCRLFPLGRIYDGDQFQYFIQIHECTREKRTKIKVKKWLDIENIKEYEEFIRCWHHLCEITRNVIAKSNDEEFSRSINANFLRIFFLKPYENVEHFLLEFMKRYTLFVEICN